MAVANRKARRRAAKTKGPSAPRTGGGMSPSMPRERFQQGIEAAAARRFEDGRAAFEAVTRLDPSHAEAHHMLGVMLEAQNRSEEAIVAIGRAIELRPEVPLYHVNLAVSYMAAGRGSQADPVLARARDLGPDSFQPNYFSGLLYLKTGRTEDALPHFQRSVEIEPEKGEAWHMLGLSQQMTGRTDLAQKSLARAVKCDPGNLDAVLALIQALTDLHKTDELLKLMPAAVREHPDKMQIYQFWADALYRAGRLEEMFAALKLGIERVGHHPGLIAYRALGRLDLGRTEDRSDVMSAALHDRSTTTPVMNTYLYTLNFRADVTPEACFLEHARAQAVYDSNWSGKRPAPVAKSPEPAFSLGTAGAEFARTTDGHFQKRIRVGYVSGDYRTHSVAFFMEPILRGHDRDRFEVYCYATSPAKDETTARLTMLSDHWRNLHGVLDPIALRRIEEDEIDILVDLSGHTRDNRLSLFAARAAPVQVTYLGYPNTTGLREMDWRITDADADPEGAERFHTEKLYRMPRGFLCYQPPGEAGRPSPPPSVKNGYITFGSFNHLAKLTDETVDLWCRVLDATPNSRLMLKGRPLNNKLVVEHTIKRFGKMGLSEDRLRIVPPIPGKSDHLAAYGEVDIGLDPIPYNGTTTTCEALWMGVPVVTLAGRSHAGRVGVSLLRTVGLKNLIAEDADRYVALTAALASDIRRLADMRKAIRPAIGKSSLTDAGQFVRDLEAAYEEMLGGACASTSAGDEDGFIFSFD